MDALTALACLARAREASKSPVGRWPAWDFDAAPVALVTTDGTVLWGHRSPPEGFAPFDAPVPDALPGPVHLGPTLTYVANSTCRLGGRITATVRLEAEQPGTRAERLILHEAFHAFQQCIRPNSGVPSHRTPFYPEDNAANNTLARAENLALASFLAGERPAREIARDVVALRATRYACMDPEWPQYEAAAEWCEGGAQAAEACAYPGTVDAEMAAALRRHNIGGAGAAYLRFYASGAAIARLLMALLGDEASRTRWLETESPYEALAHCANADPGALARWRVQDLLAEEAAATRQRRAEAAAVLAELQPPVILDVSAAPPTSFMFDPSRLKAIGGGRRLHGGHLRLEGLGWVFQWSEGPVVEDVSVGTVTLRTPPDFAPPSGEGPLDLGFLRASRARVAREGRGWRITIVREAASG